MSLWASARLGKRRLTRNERVEALAPCKHSLADREVSSGSEDKDLGCRIFDRRASARGNSTDRRQRGRSKAFLRGLVVSEDGTLKVECRVEDFSATGAKLTVNKGELPNSMYLVTACKESGFKAVVIWAVADQYGVRFEKTFPLVNVRTPESELLLPLKLARLRS